MTVSYKSVYSGQKLRFSADLDATQFNPILKTVHVGVCVCAWRWDKLK